MIEYYQPENDLKTTQYIHDMHMCMHMCMSFHSSHGVGQPRNTV